MALSKKSVEQLLTQQVADAIKHAQRNAEDNNPEDAEYFKGLAAGFGLALEWISVMGEQK